jgi:hypothetical protein
MNQKRFEVLKEIGQKPLMEGQTILWSIKKGQKNQE